MLPNAKWFLMVAAVSALTTAVVFRVSIVRKTVTGS